MGDLDEEFINQLGIIEERKEKFSEDEQNILDAWIATLSESKDSDEEKAIRNEYAQTLARLVTEEKQLFPPFSEMPPEGDLLPLSEIAGAYHGAREKKLSFNIKKFPCARRKDFKALGAIPKPRKFERPPTPEKSLNEFEDFEEMAKVIARSKGQSLSEFVVAIARHTIDFGQELRTAMKIETTSFSEYVKNVISQRIKDLTDVLNEEQNAELQKIKKDIDKWQLELSHCKKRIKEMIPDFDIDAYRKDKNYLNKVFTFDSGAGIPQDDSFKNWKEESCHRLKWNSDMILKLTRCNDQLSQEITNIKSQTLDLEAREAIKQQSHVKFINCELAKCQKLKLELDRLHKENAELLSQLEEFCN